MKWNKFASDKTPLTNGLLNRYRLDPCSGLTIIVNQYCIEGGDFYTITCSPLYLIDTPFGDKLTLEEAQTKATEIVKQHLISYLNALEE